MKATWRITPRPVGGPSNITASALLGGNGGVAIDPAELASVEAVPAEARGGQHRAIRDVTG